jgi:AcrR family transcriptional regulator
LEEQPRREHSDSARRILAAASACFARAGYKGASMSRIAREADVSKSLVHYHFATKEELFVEVQLELLRDLVVTVRQLTAGDPGSVQNLERALDTVLTWLESETDAIRVLLELHTLSSSNPDMADRLAQFNADVDAIVIDALYNLLGPAVDRLVLPVKRAVVVMRTLFDGLMLQLIYAQSEDDKQRIRQTLQDAKFLFTTSMFHRLS